MDVYVLEAFDLYRFYHTGEEETLALRGVNLQVNEGETVAIMGPSGSGKSTLLACISGIDEPDGGYVKLLGKRLTRKSDTVRAAMRAREIGIVLQSHSLLEHLSIEENIRLKMWMANKVDNKRILELLQLVGLTDHAKAFSSQISGGEAARAAIAVSMAAKPKLLLADEPTGEVDAQTEQKILQLFDIHSRNGGAAVIATHSESLAAHADRIIRLFDGRMVENA